MTRIRIATYNLENLFTRPAAMNQATDADGAEALEDHATASAIVRKATYSDADKSTLAELSVKYGWHAKNPPKSALVTLNKVRGALFKKPKNKPLEVVADGPDDWTGWFELRRDDVTWAATYNTGRVINEVNADILVAIEVENRPTLERFNEQVLGAEFGSAYPYYMVLDGNDPRGIDVGILSRFPIDTIRSHVAKLNPGGELTFSRDCPEYDIIAPGGERVVLLPNHFKSKRNGDDQESRDRRKRQADAAHEIAVTAQQRSPLVLVAGDLNDTPDSTALQSLFEDGYTDVQSHADHPTDRPGTYGTGLASGKIDYLISSSTLWDRVHTCGIERRGTYHPNVWEAFDTVTESSENASDHHCVWMDVDL